MSAFFFRLFSVSVFQLVPLSVVGNQLNLRRF